MRQGTRVVGLCGGYQMMGKKVHDPDGLEGNTTSIDGLGLLDIETVLEPKKTVQFSDGIETTTDTAVTGYEIHLGRSDGKDRLRPMIRFDDQRNDGAISPDGQAMGCYMHGLFSSDAFRSAWLKNATGKGSTLAFDAVIDSALDELADHLKTHLDLDALGQIAGLD